MNTEPERPLGWKQTTLWSRLSESSSSHAEAVRRVLNTAMPLIERILSVGGTSPLDFTLHDAGHSFRVAERMSQIIPADVLPNLSDFELALLLLAAYLHDIGMTPERRHVECVYKFLLTADQDAAWSDERKELEKWLDETHGDTRLPLDLKSNPHRSLLLANELVTDYCRHRHNDWSEQWIRENTSNLSLDGYPGFITDLITLCRSHHEGYPALVSDRFNPRYVGSPPAIVHLRYAAAALRIADVLEIDPERTPKVILRHRGVRPSSLIYWWKDAEISIRQEGGNLSVYARPGSAKVHHAVKMTVDQINSELLVCRKLADYTHFENCPGSAQKLPHRWDLNFAVTDDVRPKDSSYVYIDGSFRPDTPKLLQLLSGIELYGDELVAIRELLQNSFDAVREQIAYERLASPDPLSRELADNLAELHRVELRLELSGDGPWLVCSDTGVGMNKDIISDHLLVSGVGTRHDILDLERRCERAGFPLGRTGQFGIGVLSYFMLADQVTIRTRRSVEPGDSETTGWQFETEGVGSFGELRRDSGFTKGTEVKLHLKSAAVTADSSRWYSRLCGYLQRTIMEVPCNLRVFSNSKDCRPLELGPGFVKSGEDLASELARQIDPSRYSIDVTPEEFLSDARRLGRQREEKHWQTVKDEFIRHLYFEQEEGDLPDGLGKYRINLPRFGLVGGHSLAFLRSKRQKGAVVLKKIHLGYSLSLRPVVRMAWKGMAISEKLTRRRHRLYNSSVLSPGSIIEVDWNSPDAGRIGVSRQQLEPTEKATESFTWLVEKTFELQRLFLERNRRSMYNALNMRVLDVGPVGSEPLHWIVSGDAIGREARWDLIRRPFLSALALGYEKTLHYELEWNSQPAFIAGSLGDEDDEAHNEGLAWCGQNTRPDRVVALLEESGLRRFGVSPLWVPGGAATPNTHSAGLTCAFPPEWKHLCGVWFDSYSSDDDGASVWNQDNPIVRSVNAAAWEWSKERFAKSLDPLPEKASLLADKGKAAAWVLLCLESGEDDLWEGLPDRDRGFLRALWILLFGEGKYTSAPTVYQWIEDDLHSWMRVLTRSSWAEESGVEGGELLPVPSSEWCVIVKAKRFAARKKKK